MTWLLPAALLITGASVPTTAQEVPASVAPEDTRWVAPKLADYTDRVLFGEVWKQRDLTPRDRSLITLSALIAGGNTAQLKGHLGRALDNGVTPAEIAGVITHLAFYTGWPNAVSALGIAREVPEARGVSAAEMRRETPSAPAALRIIRKSEGPITIGPAGRFTGTARIFAPIGGDGAGISGATVRFEPGARTAWHRYMQGQTLIVIEGCGLV